MVTRCRMQAQCAALRPDIQPLAGHGVGSSDDFFAALVNALLRHQAQLISRVAPTIVPISLQHHRCILHRVVLDRWDQA
jgi:hypothetical protein